MKTHTVRQTPSRIDEVLDALDEVQCNPVGNDGRRATRRQWRARMRCRVTQPGGNSADHEVVGRNLSSSGAAFLHDGFLHVGTKCAMQIVTIDNAWVDIVATVVRCRYISGSIHEVGVVFAEPVDVNEIMHQELSGTILLVDEAEDFARLTAHLLSKGGLEVVVANQGVQALELVEKVRFDLILMDVVMPEMNGPETARRMRERGVVAPIVAITANDSDKVRQECFEAGYDRFLSKPIGRTQLTDVIRHYLARAEPITSRYADDPEMADFIRDFVADLPARIKRMQEQLQAADTEGLLSLARGLKVIASGSGGCGFDPIGEAAGMLEKALEGTPDWEVARGTMSDLAGMVGRVKSAADPT